MLLVLSRFGFFFFSRELKGKGFVHVALGRRVPVSFLFCSPSEIGLSLLGEGFHPSSHRSKAACSHSQWHGLLHQHPQPEETAAESADNSSFEPWKKALEKWGAGRALLRNHRFQPLRAHDALKT